MVKSEGSRDDLFVHIYDRHSHVATLAQSDLTCCLLPQKQVPHFAHICAPLGNDLDAAGVLEVDDAIDAVQSDTAVDDTNEDDVHAAYAVNVAVAVEATAAKLAWAEDRS